MEIDVYSIKTHPKTKEPLITIEFVFDTSTLCFDLTESEFKDLSGQCSEVMQEFEED